MCQYRFAPSQGHYFMEFFLFQINCSLASNDLILFNNCCITNWNISSTLTFATFASIFYHLSGQYVKKPFCLYGNSSSGFCLAFTCHIFGNASLDFVEMMPLFKTVSINSVSFFFIMFKFAGSERNIQIVHPNGTFLKMWVFLIKPQNNDTTKKIMP